MPNAPVPAELKETMQLMEELLVDLEKPQREIDEPTFVKVFLPLLTAKEEDEPDLRAWVAIAGSPTGRVAVVRHGPNGKEVLYVVPPLMNLNGFTKTKYMHQDSVYERVMSAMQKMRNAPMRAKEIYDDEMAKAAIDGVDVPLRDALAWNDILVKNNLQPVFGLVSTAGVVHDKTKISTEGWSDF